MKQIALDSRPGAPSPERHRAGAAFEGREGRLLLFYLGVPAIVAIYAALNNWAILQVAGYTGSLVFYAGHAFIPWWTSCLTTWLCMRVLARWRPPQIVLLVGGILLSCLLMVPYSIWITEFFAAGWLPEDANGVRGSLHIHDEIGFWSFTLRAGVIWILVNLLFDRVLGLPRYRYVVPAIPGPASTQPAAVQPVAHTGGVEHAGDAERGGTDFPATATANQAQDPRFLQRLPADVTVDDVIALKAEQHYVKVYTTKRSFMTLYRFSDAVAEMDTEVGQQVHRSYWVRNSAIRRVRRVAKKFQLELVNDLKVPVSAPNIGLIRQLAQSAGIPLVPPLS